MNPFSENAARLALVQQAVSLGHEGLDPLGSATLSMRWARPAADGLLLVSASACLQAQADCSAPSVDGAALAAGMSDPVLTGTLADTQSDVWADAWADGAGADERPGAGATPPAFDLSLPEWHPLDAASLAGLHGAIYTHRPEAGAVVLVASPYAATLACSRDVQLDGIPFFHPMVARPMSMPRWPGRVNPSSPCRRPTAMSGARRPVPLPNVRPTVKPKPAATPPVPDVPSR